MFRREKSTRKPLQADHSTTLSGGSGAATDNGSPAVATAHAAKLVKDVERLLAKSDPKGLELFAKASHEPVNRTSLLPVLPAAVDAASQFSIGSSERLNALKGIRNIAKGEQEKDRYGELQVKAYPLVSKFLVSEVRDEAADSACKEVAMHSLRNFARNYVVKPKVFETEGFTSVLFASIKQQGRAGTHDVALVLLTTLATDQQVAEGLTEYFSKEILELVMSLLASSPAKTSTNPLPEDAKVGGGTLIIPDVVHGIRLTQNLSQHDSSRLLLASSDKIIHKLSELSRVGNSLSDVDAEMQILMSLANIIGDDESKTDLLQGGREDGLLRLVGLLENVLNGNEIHFNLETVLRPLRRLCPPDKNRQAMSPKLTPLMPLALEKALEIDDRASAELAFRILSQLSFDSSNVRSLQANAKISSALQRIVQLSNSGDSASAAKWVKVARAADVLRFNLQKKGELLRRASFSRMGSTTLIEQSVSGEVNVSSSAPSNQITKLMISYQVSSTPIANVETL